MTIQILQADITKLHIDAIVNAANETLLGGGGVDGAIHRAAGPRLLDACHALPQVSPGVRSPVGDARITPGFDLPVRFVIHTVGPVWHGGEAGEPQLLAACYRNVLALAREHGLDSIAFPAISCGVYGYPRAAAATTALTVISHETGLTRMPRWIVLCAFDREMAEHYRAAAVKLHLAITD
ncbi:MAG: O-acetyl-ADP-ribose deacetylase [Pseudomonadota bacterium]|nr:O-acetyl-ADP-ribose deacetylase [Pseudomonadota bacterium]